MAEQLAQILEDRFHLPQEQMLVILRRALIMVASIVFVLVATIFVAFDSIFIQFTGSLEVGDVAPRDIVAPSTTSYESEILTERVRDEAREAVSPVFDLPNPDVARQQTELAFQILEYIQNVRADIYGTTEQRKADLAAINVLSLSEDTQETILSLGSETWNDIEGEVITILSRMMRSDIRPGQEQNIRMRLDNQVALRFNPRERDVIVDIVSALIVPNAFQNVEETLNAQDAAAAAVEPQTLTFTAGQSIVRETEVITDLQYEALVEMNLINTGDSFLPYVSVARAGVASITVMVIIGLYMARFANHLLYNETRRLALIATLFLIMLGAVRFLGVDGDIYLFPAGALALLYVAIANPHIAVIGTLGLAILTGIMHSDSLQTATLIMTSGIIGTLVLQRAERLNQFFIAGALMAINNVLVVIIFNITGASAEQLELVGIMGRTALSGLFIAPATAIVVLYIVTLLFNLPTVWKLTDLNQPSKPLLQRLLREAPGSYQHSLQVANLAEQGATAIGADAQLTHVAALYHDIGKMLNPLYFTENQQDIDNPHDTLGDPYRSADIIIGHVTEGDELAKQHRLPQRIRDFIREHHGTTEVFVFYQRALNAVDGDTSAVDIADFTYPGPRPRSKETAILMMADSCEAAVRAIKPQTRQEISDLVNKIIDSKREHGQLDDAMLTLNDIRTIRDTFVDILQSMFHPRINYQEAVGKPKNSDESKAEEPTSAGRDVKPTPKVKETSKPDTDDIPPTVPLTTQKLPPVPDGETNQSSPRVYDEEEAPMTEVPRLPTLDERRSTGTQASINGTDTNPPEAATEAEAEEEVTDGESETDS